MHRILIFDQKNNAIKKNSDLPTLFFFGLLQETNYFFFRPYDGPGFVQEYFSWPEAQHLSGQDQTIYVLVVILDTNQFI